MDIISSLPLHPQIVLYAITELCKGRGEQSALVRQVHSQARWQRLWAGWFCTNCHQMRFILLESIFHMFRSKTDIRNCVKNAKSLITTGTCIVLSFQLSSAWHALAYLELLSANALVNIVYSEESTPKVELKVRREDVVYNLQTVRFFQHWLGCPWPLRSSYPFAATGCSD